jgi:hypothetical protein
MPIRRQARKENDYERIRGVTTSLLLLVTMLLAHGNELHIMGTVTNITTTSITVKTQDGHSIDISIAQDTKFMRGTEPISAKDIKTGDRVVVHASKNGEKLVATTVAVGKTSEANQKAKNGAQSH